MLLATTSLSPSKGQRAIAKALALIFSGEYVARGKKAFGEIAKLALGKGYKAFAVVERKGVRLFALSPAGGRWEIWERARMVVEEPRVKLRPIYREREPLQAPKLPRELAFLCKGLVETYEVELGEELKAHFLSLRVREFERVDRLVGFL